MLKRTGSLGRTETGVTNQVGLWNMAVSAKRLGVSIPTLRRWVAARRIRHVRIGRQIRFDPQDLNHYIEANTIEVQRVG